MVTIICPLDAKRLGDVGAMIDAMSNPADAELSMALRPADPDGSGTHFVSLQAFASRDGRRHYILLEVSGDGDEDAALSRVVRALEPRLGPIFVHAADWPDGADLLAYLKRHSVRVGPGWFDNPGLCFAGTPGIQSVASASRRLSLDMSRRFSLARLAT